MLIIQVKVHNTYTTPLNKVRKSHIFLCPPQIFVGDQKTCKNISGAKRWRQVEMHATDRLSWAKEVPGETISGTHISTKIHTPTYLPGDSTSYWSFLEPFLTCFGGLHPTIGSLCYLQKYICRLHVERAARQMLQCWWWVYPKYIQGTACCCCL